MKAVKESKGFETRTKGSIAKLRPILGACWLFTFSTLAHTSDFVFYVPWCREVSQNESTVVRRADVRAGLPSPTIDDFLSALSSEPSVRLDNGAVYFNGRLTQKATNRVKELIEKMPSARLVINSPGGDEFAAQQFGHLIKHHRTAVEIVGQCSSACALYLLPNADRLLLNGVIGFHGTPKGCLRRLEHSGQIDKLALDTKQLLIDSVKRQNSLEQAFPKFAALVERADRTYFRAVDVSHLETTLMISPKAMIEAGISVDVGPREEEFRLLFPDLKSRMARGKSQVLWFE